MRFPHLCKLILSLTVLSLSLGGCGLKPDTLMGIPGVIGEENNGLAIDGIPVEALPAQLELTDPADPTRCRYEDTANGIVFTYPAEFSLELEYTDGYARFCDPTGAGQLLYYVDDVSTAAEKNGLTQKDGYSEFVTTMELDGKLCCAILTWKDGTDTDFSALAKFSFTKS